MKYVIDISENRLEVLRMFYKDCQDNLSTSDIAIVEGKPLDAVLDKIKTEINKLPDLNPDYEMDKTIHVSKWAVHGIIDKYKESEDKK